jgi:hypothetical protein
MITGACNRKSRRGWTGLEVIGRFLFRVILWANVYDRPRESALVSSILLNLNKQIPRYALSKTGPGMTAPQSVFQKPARINNETENC